LSSEHIHECQVACCSDFIILDWYVEIRALLCYK
jgi:hypothetical protein